MFNQSFISWVTDRKTIILLLVSVLALSVVPVATSVSLLASVAILGICLAVLAILALVYKPIIGVYYLLVFCFLLFFFTREIGGDIPYGLGIEALLMLSFVALILRSNASDWQRTNTMLTWLM